MRAAAEPPVARRPLLIYDGDCDFCRQWIGAWEAATGDRVDYVPYQALALADLGLATPAVARAVHLVEVDGRVRRGAEAALRALAHAPGHAAGWWCYRRVPGFAPFAERAYSAVASHRSLAARLSRWGWGRTPRFSSVDATARLFLRALALIAAIAFVSLGVQIAGLVGPDGVSPVAAYLDEMARRHPGPLHLWLFPTVFWASSSDAALESACLAGAAAALWAAWRVPSRSALALLYGLYLSLFYAGQDFTSFQWDLLLLELLCLATALCRHPTLLVFAVRLLLWRFMLMSGIVKLLGDPAWASFSALRHHFETQPLPTPLAWAAAGAPPVLLAAGAAGTLAVELLLPFLFLAPPRPRRIACALVVAFQLAIVATGNHGFFNLLVVAMCLALLDDRALPRWLHVAPTMPGEAAVPRAAIAFVAFSAVVGLLQLGQTLREHRGAGASQGPVLDAIAPLRIVNRYGPFASLTTERPSLVVEGTRDGLHWRPYVWRALPMSAASRPAWTVPHQPRLDWQIWFAAAETPGEQAWVGGLLTALLRGSPTVRGLLRDAPFGGADGPPRQVRVRLVLLRFAAPAPRAKGTWWIAEDRGTYLPPVVLGPDGRLQPADVERIVVPTR